MSAGKYSRTEHHRGTEPRRPALHECELPEHMTLDYPRPIQRRMGGLLVWSFKLVYQGKRGGPVEHIERYEPTIADHIQMGWAIDALTAKVHQMGYGPSRVTVLRPPSKERISHTFGLEVQRAARSFATM